MQRKVFLLLAALLLGSYTGLQAQRPVFPKPDRANNVPFGQKQSWTERKGAPAQELSQWLAPGADRFKQPNLPARPLSKTLAAMSKDPGNFLVNQMMNRKPGITQAVTKSRGIGSDYHVLDVNPMAESDPGNITTYVSPLDWLYPVANNVAYFEADDGVHGRELVRCDGTAAGTWMVKDINPGTASTIIYNMTAINNKVFFAASTDGYRFFPWVTDGAAAGTQLLDATGVGFSYSPQQFIQVGNTIYIIQDGYYYRTALWKTDGTPAGTGFLLELAANEFNYEIQQATDLNGVLFFTAYSGSFGRQVWRSDGTAAGTYIVKNVGVGYDWYGPMQLTAYANKLFFSADDGTGRKLWISDGTEAGTVPAAGSTGVLPGTEYLSYNNTQPFPIVNGVLYLPGYTAEGNGWYKYDAATGDGLVWVQDLYPPGEDGFIIPGETRLVGHTLYLKVVKIGPGGGDELWKTTGTDGHIQLVKSFAGEPGSYMINLKSGYDKLYFFKYDAVYGSELWKSDGTTAGTMIVRDVNAGPKSSVPWYMTECNGKVIFNLHGDVNWAEPWSTDGTVKGTSLVKDINTTTTPSSWAGTFYNGIIPTHNGVLFGAYNREMGGELYESNGTSNGTNLVKEIFPGEDWSYPNSMVLRNGSYFFIADNPDGTAIYNTDGTKKGLKQLIPAVKRDQFWVVNFDIAENGRIFYLIGNWLTGAIELWTTDATSAGTVVLSTNVNYVSGMITCGNDAFFGGGDFSTGYELWKSDGSLAGTKMVKDIFPGWDGSYPYSFVAYKGSVYFGAYTDYYNATLWKTDGTEAGTNRFANLQWPWSIKNEGLKTFVCISNNELFFNAFSLENFESRLWKTNGTPAGTQQVSDVIWGGLNLTDVDGTLFFEGYTPETGLEPWKLAPGAKTATLVKDLTPGFWDSYFTYPTAAAGKLYFVLNDLLWSSDGTAAGTNAVNDALLNRLTGLGFLAASNNKLFLSGYSFPYGTELIVGNTRAAQFIAQPLNRAAPEFGPQLTVYPNPARDEISVSFSRQEDGLTILSITNLAGQVMQTKKINAKKGNNTVPVSTRLLPAGSYLVKQDGAANRSTQFVKTE
jgi:ELWxxDGT repeat protein